MVTTMTSEISTVDVPRMRNIASRWRHSRVGSWTMHVIGTGLAVSTATLVVMYLLLPLTRRASVRVLTLTMDGCLWLAAAMSAGTDPWGIASAVGRAAWDALATREASGVLLVLACVGTLACYWLQRWLGTDTQSSR